ncbi:MAG: alkane 1-monooxygenase [Myxococcota bacterium]|nr:alkane 1-monooxygenase [Myxococcota bacterium]
MKIYHASHPTLGEVSYYDRKRLLWVISALFPFLLPLLGVFLFIVTRAEWTLGVPLLIAYGVIPLLDAWIGEDLNNPPAEVVPQLEADSYYRLVLYVTVPLHALTLVSYAYFVSVNTLSLFGTLLAAIVCGLSNGFAINTAHELGHKHRNAMSKFFAKLALAIPFYGHFTVEHNLGHHRWVATPEDPASSRLGEPIYHFALRELSQTFLRGLQLERARLQRRGRAFFCWKNQVLQSYMMSVVLQGTLIYLFGWLMLPFLCVHNFFAWLQLTSANYIEHYGLLREKNARGKYGPCRPHHSWNSNHILSNLTLFNLERHSDHHANPGRSYQSLRDFPDLPRLPNGYFGMYLLSYFPPLWFYVMDRRVLALPHVAGDLSRVNVDPRKQAYYEGLYPAQSEGFASGYEGEG